MLVTFKLIAAPPEVKLPAVVLPVKVLPPVFPVTVKVLLTFAVRVTFVVDELLTLTLLVLDELGPVVPLPRDTLTSEEAGLTGVAVPVLELAVFIAERETFAFPVPVFPTVVLLAVTLLPVLILAFTDVPIVAVSLIVVEDELLTAKVLLLDDDGPVILLRKLPVTLLFIVVVVGITEPLLTLLTILPMTEAVPVVAPPTVVLLAVRLPPELKPIPAANVEKALRVLVKLEVSVMV